jgi:hypothetical protein
MLEILVCTSPAGPILLCNFDIVREVLKVRKVRSSGTDTSSRTRNRLKLTDEEGIPHSHDDELQSLEMNCRWLGKGLVRKKGVQFGGEGER